MRQAVASHPPRPSRPGLVRVAVWTAVGMYAAAIVTTFALLLPVSALTADVPVLWAGDQVPADGAWSVAVTVAFVLLLGVVCLPIVRGALRWTSDTLPATTWLVVPLAAGAALALLVPGISGLAGGLVAAMLIWRLAYLDDGTARPEPVRLGLRTAIAIPLVIGAGALAVIAAYALRHPLRATQSVTDQRVARGTTPTTVPGPTLENTGRKPVRVVAIRAEAQHGSALRLLAPRMSKAISFPPEPATVPFHAFTLRPGASSPDLELLVSRAGCRPGATGAIDSVRVIFASGRSQVVLLGQRPTLAC